MLLAEYALVKDIASEAAANIFEGGPGSGNWGHKGRPGKRGGSLPGGSGISAHVTGTGKMKVEGTVEGKAFVGSTLKGVLDKYRSVTTIKEIVVADDRSSLMSRLKKDYPDDYDLDTITARFDHSKGRVYVIKGNARDLLHEFGHSIEQAFEKPDPENKKTYKVFHNYSDGSSKVEIKKATFVDSAYGLARNVKSGLSWWEKRADNSYESFAESFALYHFKREALQKKSPELVKFWDRMSQIRL